VQVAKLIEKGEQPKKKKRKNKYIPGLAAFYFRPEFSWTKEEARQMHEENRSESFDKILYEDCITGMKKLENESIDLIIADPPFGLNFTGKESIYNRNSGLVQEDYHEVDVKDYLEFSENWMRELSRIMKKTASAFIFSGWTNLRDVLIAIEESGLKMINHLIWKYQFGVFTKRKFVSSHYHLLWVVRDEKKYFFNKVEHYPLDVWEIKRTYKRGEKKNGTKLPIPLIERCIHFCSKPGDLVLDPFMGNGTTAVAAKGLYRHFLGFEINKSMKPIIDNALNNIVPGEKFVPYDVLFKPDLEKLRKEYPKAYREFLKKKRQKV